MAHELIKYAGNIVQTTSNILALSNKLHFISEAETWYQLAMDHLKNENYLHAKKCVLKALELHPGFYNAHLEIIAICLNMNEYEDALHYADLALKQFPENAAFLYSRGIIRTNLFEKHEEAIADLSRAIELGQLLAGKAEWFYECYLERAIAKEQMGDKEGSDSDLMMHRQLRDIFERNKRD